MMRETRARFRRMSIVTVLSAAAACVACTESGSTPDALAPEVGGAVETQCGCHAVGVGRTRSLLDMTVASPGVITRYAKGTSITIICRRDRDARDASRTHALARREVAGPAGWAVARIQASATRVGAYPRTHGSDDREGFAFETSVCVPP